jgi:hypothetical protein
VLHQYALQFEAEKLAEASKNAEWARKHKDVNELIKILNQINPAKGVDANKDLWKKLKRWEAGRLQASYTENILNSLQKIREKDRKLLPRE